MFDDLTSAERWELIDRLNDSVQRTAGKIHFLCSRRYIPIITMRRLRRSYRYRAVLDDVADILNDVFTADNPDL